MQNSLRDRLSSYRDTAKDGMSANGKKAATFSAAALGFAAAVGTAEAGIVFEADPYSNLEANATNPSPSALLIDVNGDKYYDFSVNVSTSGAGSRGGARIAGFINTFKSKSGKTFQAINGVAANKSFAADISAGQPIGSGLIFSQKPQLGSFARRGETALFGPFFDGGTLGLKFYATDGVHYGWLQIDLEVGSLILDFQAQAFNDSPFETINAGDIGDIPEPSSLALLALGAVGVMARRRRVEDKA